MVAELIKQGNESVKDTGFVFFITDGFRSLEEQTKLYAQGRTVAGAIVTNARAGESAHNFGLAVDCAFQKDGKLSYVASLYNRVYPIARSLGFSLGADWKSFSDKPHFEYPNWESAIKKPLPPQGGGTSMSTIPVEKQDFENLVSKATKYDALAAVGISMPSDIEALKRNVLEANQASKTSSDEAKKTREDFNSFVQQLAEKLNSPQDLPRMLSSLDEVLKQLDTANANSKKDTEEKGELQSKNIELQTEVTRTKILLSQQNPLDNSTTQELLLELLRRLTAILRR